MLDARLGWIAELGGVSVSSGARIHTIMNRTADVMNHPRLSFSHLGVAVLDLERAIEEYASVFGYKVVSGPFEDPIQRVKVCFLGRALEGPFQIELVAPLGEDSPVTRFITKGVVTYHTCYDVDDLDRALAFVREQGCFIVAEPVPAVAFNQRRIAWFYTRTRHLVEMVETK